MQQFNIDKIILNKLHTLYKMDWFTCLCMHTYYGHTILHRHSLSIQEDFFQIYVSLLWEVKDILGILKGTLNSWTKGEMFAYD